MNDWWMRKVSPVKPDQVSIAVNHQMQKVMVSLNFSKCCSIALSVFNKEDVSSWQSSDPDLWPAACVGLELIRVSHTVNHCSVNNRGTKCCLCHWRWACFSKRPTSMHHLEGKNATDCPLVMVSGWHFESCTHVKCVWCNVFHHPPFNYEFFISALVLWSTSLLSGCWLCFTVAVFRWELNSDDSTSLLKKVQTPSSPAPSTTNQRLWSFSNKRCVDSWYWVPGCFHHYIDKTQRNVSGSAFFHMLCFQNSKVFRGNNWKKIKSGCEIRPYVNKWRTLDRT